MVSGTPVGPMVEGRSAASILALDGSLQEGGDELALKDHEQHDSWCEDDQGAGAEQRKYWCPTSLGGSSLVAAPAAAHTYRGTIRTSTKTVQAALPSQTAVLFYRRRRRLLHNSTTH